MSSAAVRNVLFRDTTKTSEHLPWSRLVPPFRQVRAVRADQPVQEVRRLRELQLHLERPFGRRYRANQLVRVVQGVPVVQVHPVHPFTCEKY